MGALRTSCSTNNFSKLGIIKAQRGVARQRDEILGTVKMLLDRGVQVNTVWNNETPLTHVMLRILPPSTRTDVLRMLLERGADVNARSQHGYKPTALMRARDEGTPRCSMELLLEHGADVNIRDTKGDTALSEVARFIADGNKSSPETIRFLLDRGAPSYDVVLDALSMVQRIVNRQSVRCAQSEHTMAQLRDYSQNN